MEENDQKISHKYGKNLSINISHLNTKQDYMGLNVWKFAGIFAALYWFDDLYTW